MSNNHNNLKPNLIEYADIFFKYGNLPADFSNGSPIWSIGLYVRLSKDDGNSVSLSIVNQIKKHARFLKTLEDFVVYDIYIDDGLTGTDFEREGYIRMQEDVAKKLINCIIVIDLTRYARNLADGIKELDTYVLKHNIRFISIDIPSVDTFKAPTAISSPEVYQALNAAEDFARTTSKKVRAIKEIKREDGEKNGGFPPYGYLPNPDGEHWLYDPVAGAIKQQMYLWSIEGLSDIAIAKRLNAQGILNPTAYKKSLGLKYCSPRSENNSGLWWSSTVRRILEDMTNIGYSVQGKSSSFDHKRHKQIYKKKDEYIAVPGCHESTVTEEIFYQVQEIRKQRTRVTKAGKIHMFANLVYCSSCGFAMKKTSAKGSNYLVCRTYKSMGKEHCASKRSINMKTLEDIVLKIIQSQIALIIDLQAIIENINQQPEKSNASSRINHRLETCKQAFSKAENLLDSSYYDWKNNDISKEQYLRVKEKTETELKQLRTTINSLLIEQEKISTGIDGNNDYFQKFIKHRNIEVLDRAVLLELIDKIYINEDKSIRIEFKYQDQFMLIMDYIESNKKSQKTLDKKK